MKILVTGACGFIGSHLCEALLGHNHDVVGMAQFGQRHFWSSHLASHPSFTPVMSDIREQSSFPDDIRDVEMIYHLAALGDVPSSKALPFQYAETNIIGTLNMARLCTNLPNNPRLVLMSTSEIYGGVVHGTSTLHEVDEPHPRSVYAATKISAEYMVRACGEMYGLNYTIVRGFNTYGPRQSSRGVISWIVENCLREDTDEIPLGNVNTARDFVYVYDMAQALASLAAMPRTFVSRVPPLNIATGEAHTISTIVDLVQSLCGTSKKVVLNHDRLRGDWEVDVLKGNSDAFRKATGWRPTYTLEQGLDEYICWCRAKSL